MRDKDKIVLQKILTHIKAILRYTEKHMELDDFEADTMCVEACVFNLMQIGELAKMSLSDEAKETISSIPWNQLYGMRNRIVHGYDGVKLIIVWDTIKEDLPKLKEELENSIDLIPFRNCVPSKN